MKAIFLKLLIFTVVVIICGAVFIFYQYISLPDKITNDLKEKQCRGVIKSIIKSQPSFFTIRIMDQNVINELTVSNGCGVSNKFFFGFAAIGDSLTKEKGTLELLVHKMTTGEIRKFPYPYCFQ